MVSPCCLRPHGATASEIKKPAWRNTQRYSTTSAYSSTSPPAKPGCPLPGHPTTSIQHFSGAECEVHMGSVTILHCLARKQKGKEITLRFIVLCHGSVRSRPSMKGNPSRGCPRAFQELDFLLTSRTRGAYIKVKSTTSSPVAVLMSWCSCALSCW